MEYQPYTGIEIFPPIGIARAGDSSEFYFASEDPSWEHDTHFPGFRGNDGKIKRSAVKFHAYLCNADGKPTTEAKAPDFTLKWTVNVANKKAAWVKFRGKLYEETFRLRNPSVQPYDKDASPSYEHTNTRHDLIIEASAEISGPNVEPIPLAGFFKGSTTTRHPVNLGEIRTDDEGRLVFLAGTGHANCVLPGDDKPPLLEWYDNDDWYDTMCDGNVTVEVSSNLDIDDESYKSTLKTVVIGAPPKFTSGLYCPTSLYDLIENIYERPARARLGRKYDCGTVYYDDHIKPIFEGVRRLSWVNLKANEGHGPYKASRFLDSSLSDKSDASKPFRRNIFQRVRAPVRPDDPADKFIRNKQAQEYYMPRLGGNSGDIPQTVNDDNHRDRWASLTELQYDRLAKWAEGEFETVDPRPPKSETEIYTLAALKWTTGTPFCPGIEVDWITEFSRMYNPDSRFRFHDDVQAGDLTRGLSLPWQSDFYMWPHVRPDVVVSEDTWTEIKDKFGDHPVPAERLTKRDPWDEGLATDDSDDNVGSTEMVKKWNQLGFISKVQSSPDIYVESERLLPHSGTYTIFNIGQEKYVGQKLDSGPDSGPPVRHIVAVDEAQTWNIEYIEDDLYLTIEDYTAGTHGSDIVDGYKTVPDQEWGTWIIEASGTSGYKIRVAHQVPIFWTLESDTEDTQVTVAENNNNDNQIWRIVPAS